MLLVERPVLLAEQIAEQSISEVFIELDRRFHGGSRCAWPRAGAVHDA